MAFVSRKYSRLLLSLLPTAIGLLLLYRLLRVLWPPLALTPADCPFLPPTYDDVELLNRIDFYTTAQHKHLATVEPQRIVSVSGFQFCSALDGSSFDALVPIRDLVHSGTSSSLAFANPDISDFVNLVDSRAYDIYQAMMRKSHLAHLGEVRRIACYFAAEVTKPAFFVFLIVKNFKFYFLLCLLYY